jgi:hypothetical protein
MSETRDAFGPLLQKLQADVRSIKRDLAMLRSQQSELPTMTQFETGLDAIDQRMTELVDGLGKSQNRIEVMLTDIARKLDA